MPTPKTILTKGYAVRKEGIAGGTVRPGALVAGFATITQAAAGSARKAFAFENDIIGKGIGDAYAAGETVQVAVAQPGAEVYALLADTEDVAAGAALQAAANGELAEHDGYAPVIAYAIAALDNSSGGAPARILVEVA